MKGNLFSPGKLLLTSEYFVLDGALALAVPTKLGQEFFFDEKPDGNSEIIWEAYHENVLWLTARISYKNWQILDTNNADAAAFVVKVLKNVQEMSSTKLKSDISYFLKTNLQFPSSYGLGSSSTLMNNLAQWAAIDPFELNEKSLGGSGYDIAVAKEKSAVLFQRKDHLKICEKVHYKPEFSDELIFIHLNQKQDSREGISLYRKQPKSAELIHVFTEITEKVLKTKNIKDYEQLMVQHEKLVSDFIGLPTVKSQHFPDCPAFVKSLGAWGGDFVISAKFEGYRDYFREKGFPAVFNWNSLLY